MTYKLSEYEVRTKTPSETNSFYIKKGKVYEGVKGTSKGKEIDDETHSVLPNCVGYCLSRIAEYQSDIAGEFKQCTMNSMNAQNVWKCGIRESNGSWIQSQEPQSGSIMCYRKNSKAGHVAICEKINEDRSILVSASDYGGKRFYTKTMNYPYAWKAAGTFQGFLHNPEIVDDTQIEMPEPVERDTTKNQVKIIATALRVRSGPSTEYEAYQGLHPEAGCIYDIFSVKDEGGYIWCLIKEDDFRQYWIATTSKWVEYLPAEKGEPEEEIDSEGEKIPEEDVSEKWYNKLIKAIAKFISNLFKKS